MRLGWRRRAAADDDAPTLRRAIRRFIQIAAVCLVVVAAAAYVLSGALAEREALRDATMRAEGIAHGVAAPLVTEKLREGDPRSIARVGSILGARIAEGGVTHVVLWGSSGKILWASEIERVGKTYPLGEDATNALVSLGTLAHLPEDASEHVEEFYDGAEQLEVYVGALGRDGEPFLFEVYLPPDRIEADQAAVFPKLLGVSLGSMFLFLALTVPVALSLARRVDEAQRSRADAVDRSVASWHHQRRLLAQDLHDGVTQDLAVLGYGLSLLEDRVDQDETTKAILPRLQEAAGHAEAALRSLILGLTPRELSQRGLSDAIIDLVQQYGRHGLDVTVSYPRGLDFPEGTGILAFRTVREGLRNVVKHTDATQVQVDVRRGAKGQTLDVEITDDGSSPASANALGSGQGLRLLADTLVAAGGSLHLGAAPGSGSSLIAVIPLLKGEPGRP